VFPADPEETYGEVPVSPGYGSFGRAAQEFMGQPIAVPKPPPWPPQQGTPARKSAMPGYGEPYGEPVSAPPAARRKGLKIVGGLLVIVLLAVVGVVVKSGVGGLLDAATGNDPSTATAPSGVPTTGAAAATPAGPFDDTPAAKYAEGDAGITLPPATAVAGFTEAQVAAGLQQVKSAVVAARLDPAMLVSHDPNGLLKLLSPRAGKDIKPYFDDAKFFGFATQLAPGYTLTNDKIRVTGRVTFRGNTANGVRLLEVVTNFVWVYPFAGALQEAGDHLVIVHDEVTWVIPVETDVDKDYRGLRISGWDGFASNMDCEQLKKSLLALGKPQFVTSGPDDDSNSAFDPSRSLEVASTC
jgi:hypothetical protein